MNRLASGMLVLWCLLLPLAVGAQNYLRPNSPDGVALLPPPPAVGSAEHAADLASARAVFNGRTPAEEAHAIDGASLSIYNFASVIGPDFQAENLPKTDALFRVIRTNISSVINIAKDNWNRRRPYELDPELFLGKPERSTSYPSGHSTRGIVQSLLLAELFPEKREDILALGRQIGWDRVLIGKHFPTDVFAGRVLGQAIVRELLANPEFQRDLAAARAEVLAFQAAQKHVRQAQQ